MSELKERELEDDYPIFPGYLYVVDGRPWQSPGATTAGELRRIMNVKSVKNCDIGGRNLWHLAV